MKGVRLNSSNLDGTGAANANPYDIVQNGGRKRRTKSRTTRGRTTRGRTTRGRTTRGRKTKSRTKKARSAPGTNLIKTAYKYFNIY